LLLTLNVVKYFP